MKFLTITNEFQIKWDRAWLQAVGLKPHVQNQLIVEFENQFYVTFMPMQSGVISWMVVHTPIDGFVKFRGGSLPRVINRDHDHIRLTATLNEAMAELTSEWLPQFRPKE